MINRAMIVKRYMRHVAQQSNGRKHVQLPFILRLSEIVHHTCEYTKRCKMSVIISAMHCDNLDCIRSRLNSVRVHYF